MKLNKVQVALIIVWIVPIIILISAIYSRHKQLEFIIANSPKKYAEYITNTVAQWKSNTFVSLSLSNELRSQISTLVSSNPGHSLLSEHQQNMLLEEFNDFFNAYSIGTYEAYCQYRFPPHVAWHWKANGCGYIGEKTSAEVELARYYKDGPIFGGIQFIYNFQTNYGFYPTKKITRKPPEGMDARFKEYIFQYSNCSFYSNYWTGINIDKSSLVIAQTNKVPQPMTKTAYFPMQEQRLATVARSFPNLGYIDNHTLLEFDNSVEDVVSQNGEVLVADAFFYIDTSPPDDPYPILVRFYWSPADDRWLPGDFIVCTVKASTLRYPIF